MEALIRYRRSSCALLSSNANQWVFTKVSLHFCLAWLVFFLDFGTTYALDIAPTHFQVAPIVSKSISKGGDQGGRTTFLGIILPPKDGAVQLKEAWDARKTAVKAKDQKNIITHEQKILQLREELAYKNLYSFSIVIGREIEAIIKDDCAEAYRRALFALAIAPELPSAHWQVAYTSWKHERISFIKTIGAVWNAFKVSFQEPRWRSSIILEIIAYVVLAALVAFGTMLAIVFFKHSGVFLHDFNHLFSHAASSVLTGFLAIFIIIVPFVFGFGFIVCSIFLTASVWLYMSRVEKLVIGLALTLICLVPWLVPSLVKKYSFNNATAEAAWFLENGGLEGIKAREILENNLEKDSTSPAESLILLGKWYRRHGQITEAVSLLRKAAELRASSPQALVELGNALLLLGDIESARGAYRQALQSDNTRAEIYYNLVRVLVLISKASPSLREQERINEYSKKVADLDSELSERLHEQSIDYRANRFIASIALDSKMYNLFKKTDLAGIMLLKESLQKRFFGPIPKTILFPTFMIVLGLFLVTAIFVAAPSTQCAKCGKPVCSRCNTILAGNGLCGQCTTIFVQRSPVNTAVRMAKEKSIQQYQKIKYRVAQVISFILPGSGHIFLGYSIKGTILLLAFFVLFLPCVGGELIAVPVGRFLGVGRTIVLSFGWFMVWVVGVRDIFRRTANVNR